MRTNIDIDDDLMAQAMQAGGACEIVVHARTKLDGYRPPAYWEQIPAIRAAVSVPDSPRRRVPRSLPCGSASDPPPDDG